MVVRQSAKCACVCLVEPILRLGLIVYTTRCVRPYLVFAHSGCLKLFVPKATIGGNMVNSPTT